jgi:hypothetical protein
MEGWENRSQVATNDLRLQAGQSIGGADGRLGCSSITSSSEAQERELICPTSGRVLRFCAVASPAVVFFNGKIARGQN